MSGWYSKGLEGIADRTIDLTAATLKAMLIDTGAYTPALATDANLSDVPAGARIGTAVALTSKTYAGGVLDAADISFTGLVGAPTCEAILLFIDTGTATTSRLVALIDSGSGLPTPAGVNTVNVTWDNTTNKIAKL